MFHSLGIIVMLLSKQLNYWILAYTIGPIFLKNCNVKSFLSLSISKMCAIWICAPKHRLLLLSLCSTFFTSLFLDFCFGGVKKHLASKVPYGKMKWFWFIAPEGEFTMFGEQVSRAGRWEITSLTTNMKQREWTERGTMI